MPISHIDNLDPERRRYALQMFAKLADDQRGDPEKMGGAQSNSFNPGLNHAQGEFTHLTEHVGDLTHRMAQSHCDEQNFFYDLVKKKVSMALRELSRPKFSASVEGQLKSEYDFRKNNKQKVPLWDEWVSQWCEAGRKYAAAHASLTVWNRAQFCAREAAVALGLRDWAGARHELEVLSSRLTSPEVWEKFAGEVWLDSNGEIVPVSVSSNNISLKEDEEPKILKLSGKMKTISDNTIVLNIPKKDAALETRLREFMIDLHLQTYAHPFIRRSRTTENAVLDCVPWEGTIHIHDIQTMEPKSGGGGEALKLLCDLADKHNVILSATCKAFGTNPDYMTTKQLMNWYAKYGFILSREKYRHRTEVDGFDIVRQPRG
jgi:hypothetical protein